VFLISDNIFHYLVKIIHEWWIQYFLQCLSYRAQKLIISEIMLFLLFWLKKSLTDTQAKVFKIKYSLWFSPSRTNLTSRKLTQDILSVVIQNTFEYVWNDVQNMLEEINFIELKSWGGYLGNSMISQTGFREDSTSSASICCIIIFIWDVSCRRSSKYGVAGRRRTSKMANKNAGKSVILKLYFNSD
jgi:hypothetical protein